jgi:hypothetical protein
MCAPTLSQTRRLALPAPLALAPPAKRHSLGSGVSRTRTSSQVPLHRVAREAHLSRNPVTATYRLFVANLNRAEFPEERSPRRGFRQARGLGRLGALGRFDGVADCHFAARARDQIDDEVLVTVAFAELAGSRSRSPLTGFTLVAAQRPLRRSTRNVTSPSRMSPPIQSSSSRARGPRHPAPLTPRPAPRSASPQSLASLGAPLAPWRQAPLRAVSYSAALRRSL